MKSTYVKNRKTMTSADFARFSRQSIDGFTQKYNFLITGSFSDLPLQYYLEKPSDVDLLSWHNDIHINPENVPFPKHFTGQFYQLETCYSPEGFARIIAYNNRGNGTYCGKGSRLAEPNNGPAFTQVRFDDDSQLTTDLVIGLRYSVWPSNATEWKERTRLNDWPSNEVIRTIINNGCHLVLKAHHSHPDDENEWRFSFSLAESILARTWNDVQRYIYRTLRLIKSNIVKKVGGNEHTVLRTYHFKTLMFWACEEEASSFWEETRIESSVKELLLRMIQCVIEKKCRNYFIPSCNLFDDQSIDSEKEIDLILSYVQEFTLKLPQQLITENYLHVSLPRKCILMLQMGLNCQNFANPQKPDEVISSLNRLARSSLLNEEIQWIYNAVSTQRDIYSDCDNELEKYSEVTNCFALAKKNDMEYDTFPIMIRPCDSAHDIIINHFCYIKEEFQSSSKNQYQDTKNDRSFLNQYGFFLAILMNVAVVLNQQFIRPSYFLRAAYEANFHYTVLHDYNVAKQICDDAFEVLRTQKFIEVLKLGAEWVAFASDCFSILINEEWIRLYDEAIVTTIGFLGLYNAVRASIGKLNTAPKTVIYFREIGCLIRPKDKLAFRINPIHFLRYISLKCSRLMDDEPQSNYSIEVCDFLTVCLMVGYRMDASR